ncbi:MAG: thioredoxin family protein [Epulopiscium sp.]|nr:thioredoxin family protein [Candidatus Epulonipiscium sp.]
MQKVQSWDQLEDKRKEKNKNVSLFYFTSKTCPVCHVLLPRVEKLVSIYPKISAIHIDIEKIPKAQGEFMVFSAPTVLIFWEGKEIFRQSRFIRLEEVEECIKKYI